MKSEAGLPSLIVFSLHFYRLLLLAYPSRFRREYGSHMQQVFRDCCLYAYRKGGPPELLALWTHTTFDFVKSLLYERFLDRSVLKGVYMSKQRFIQFGNWSLFLSGIAISLAAFTQWFSNGPYDPYNAYSKPIDQFIEASLLVLAPATFLLLTIGVAGLFLRYTEGNSLAVKLSLGFSLVGAVMALVAILPLLLLESGSAWFALSIGLTLAFSGLLVFGILALKDGLQTRGGLFLVLAGIYFPTTMLVGMISEALTGRWWDISPTLGIAGMIITGLSLAVFGYLQLMDRPAELQTAV